MTKKKYALGPGFSVLVMIAFLQACAGSSDDPSIKYLPTIIDSTTQNEIAPTNTPFQPSIDIPTYTLEAGTLQPATSDQAFPSPTNSSDIASPIFVPLTQPPASSTSPLPTQPPANPTSPPPAQPPGNPTITPDIPTPPPPGDPRIAIVPYNIIVGGTLQIILEEFGANENVFIEVYQGAQSNNLRDSFAVTVNSAGDLTFNWTVPQNYAADDYSVLATGQTFGKKIAGYFRVR